MTKSQILMFITNSLSQSFFCIIFFLNLYKKKSPPQLTALIIICGLASSFRFVFGFHSVRSNKNLIEYTGIISGILNFGNFGIYNVSILSACRFLTFHCSTIPYHYTILYFFTTYFISASQGTVFVTLPSISITYSMENSRVFKLKRKVNDLYWTAQS